MLIASVGLFEKSPMASLSGAEFDSAVGEIDRGQREEEATPGLKLERLRRRYNDQQAWLLLGVGACILVFSLLAVPAAAFVGTFGGGTYTIYLRVLPLVGLALVVLLFLSIRERIRYADRAGRLQEDPRYTSEVRLQSSAFENRTPPTPIDSDLR